MAGLHNVASQTTPGCASLAAIDWARDRLGRRIHCPFITLAYRSVAPRLTDIVGEALDRLASEVPRSELWLTHKIDGMPTGEYTQVKARVQAMLELAHTDYLDALLIHYPMPRGADLGSQPTAHQDQSGGGGYVDFSTLLQHASCQKAPE